jgi:hypothetical protein
VVTTSGVHQCNPVQKNKCLHSHKAKRSIDEQRTIVDCFAYTSFAYYLAWQIIAWVAFACPNFVTSVIQCEINRKQFIHPFGPKDNSIIQHLRAITYTLAPVFYSMFLPSLSFHLPIRVLLGSSKGLRTFRATSTPATGRFEGSSRPSYQEVQHCIVRGGDVLTWTRTDA